MTKKYIYILFLLLLTVIFIINDSAESTELTFIETYDNNAFDNYVISFKECELGTNNFIEKFLYFKDKDFKILEIKPYINESYINLFLDKQFLFYSNNLYEILNQFKNQYLEVMKDNENYIANVCIEKVKINTSMTYINEFQANF